MDFTRRTGHGPIPQWVRTKAEELSLCARYEAGESAVKIAETCDVSPDMIYKILRSHNVQRRPGGQPIRITDGEKPCNTCGVVKPLVSFHRCSARKDGRKGQCKSCHNAVSRPSDNRRAKQRRDERARKNARRCPLCDRTLPGDRSHFRGMHGENGSFDTVCKECIDELARRSWRDGIDKPLTGAKLTAVRMKMLTMQHYSGLPVPECSCCGEREFLFLSLDHIEGGGNRHRKALGTAGGYMFYRILRREGFPPGYRVLCFNCNSARGYYGRCPHEVARAATILTNERTVG